MLSRGPVGCTLRIPHLPLGDFAMYQAPLFCRLYLKHPPTAVWGDLAMGSRAPVGCTLSIPPLPLGGFGDGITRPFLIGRTLSIPQLPLGGFHEDGRLAIYLAGWEGFEAKTDPLPSSTTTTWLDLIFSNASFLPEGQETSIRSTLVA